MQLDHRLFATWPAGTGGFSYDLPGLADAHHPRLAEAIAQLEQADAAARTAQETARQKGSRKPGDPHTEAAEAADAYLHAALNQARDLAVATTSTRQQHAREGYALAALRYQRAIGEALDALHTAATHANLLATARDTPLNLGIDKATRDQAYARVLALAAHLEQAGLPNLD